MKNQKHPPIDCQSTSCLRQSSITEHCSGSVYGGPSQLTTLTPHLPAPLFLLEVAPSILQNALRLASQLLQLAPFHKLASQPLNPHSMLLFSDPAITPCLTFALESQTNGQSQTFWCSVWLSRTLGHVHQVCCKVILAPVHTGSSSSTFWSPATHQVYKTPFIDRFGCLFCFCFGFNAHPPYMPFQPALWLSLCLSLLACNASWVELWSKHQDNQKAMEKPQSKTFHTPKKKKKTRIRISRWLLSSISYCMNRKKEMLPKNKSQTWCELNCIRFYRWQFGVISVKKNPNFPVVCFLDVTPL